MKKIGCYDCGREYGDEYGFPDLIIPDHAWKSISPTKDEGGLLCPSCICKRLFDAGINNIEGSFMSGPIKSIDSSLMSVMQKIQNIRDNI